jgi:hypothetical protein
VLTVARDRHGHRLHRVTGAHLHDDSGAGRSGHEPGGDQDFHEHRERDDPGRLGAVTTEMMPELDHAAPVAGSAPVVINLHRDSGDRVPSMEESNQKRERPAPIPHRPFRHLERIAAFGIISRLAGQQKSGR